MFEILEFCLISKFILKTVILHLYKTVILHLYKTASLHLCFPDWDDHHDDDDELRPNNGEHPIILWRRFLTLKGNPNTYAKSSVHHKRMFESLSDILDMLLWLDDNKDKQDR